ncbi:Translation initiation factor 2 [Rubellimicrobium mesophilum DSM 19309]|uniref:Translation initiation factor IF-2 n=1 Tax=Rubellimicrobium mesophilum DSM 19309 TaxID=442562 RepID=A0A017HPF1_9RHOB|nr:Translation initiation factor 2 [Rubellimicrobium mesophilum DSM 19309]
MTTTGEKKTLSLGPSSARPSPLKPGFAPSRTKAVVVETRDGKRVVAPPPSPKPSLTLGVRSAPLGVTPRTPVAPEEPANRPAGMSAAELERRARVLAAARAREAEEAAQRAAEEAAREEERTRRRAEIEAREQEEAARAAAEVAQRAAEEARAEEARIKAEADARAKAEEEAREREEAARAEAARRQADEEALAARRAAAQASASAARAPVRPNPSPMRSAARGIAAPGGAAKRPAGLSEAELERRRKALAAARANEAEDTARRAAEEAAREEERARRRAEIAAREQEEAARAEAARVEAELKAVEAARKAQEDARLAIIAARKAAAQAAPTSRVQIEPGPPPSEEDRRAALQARRPDRDKGDARGAAKEKAAKPARETEERRGGRMTLNQALGDGDRRQSMAAARRKQERARAKAMGTFEAREKIVRDVQLPEAITVAELAGRMAERVTDVIKALMRMGVMATQNQTLDADTAEILIEEFGHRVVRVSDADVEQAIDTVVDAPEALRPRPPIVTIMGHVDHGKTSLLDAIRKTNVVSGEAGGITQHIGAYQVTAESGVMLTFLDTPGHAAFTSMRARGANVTDIVVLVVAADDAVMPQTVEAISHARAAGVPLIVAINKIDKYDADPQKVRTALLQHEVVVEQFSGDVQDVEVSAKTGQGLDSLLDAIALQSEVLELRANPERTATGAVIEAKLDVGRGPVATVLVQNGTLKKGDIFVVGESWGKVRALIDDKGQTVTEAGPSTPVEVLGLAATPQAGDVLNVVETEAQAREIADYRAKVARDKRAAAGAAQTLEQLMARAKADAAGAELALVVKADVQGSAEAIVQALEKVGNEEVRVRVLHSGVGAITESDVGLAEASKTPIIGFNVRANASARASAHQKGVELRYYSIIYDLVDDIKAAASGLLKAEVREKFIGYARILEVFKVSGVGGRGLPRHRGRGAQVGRGPSAAGQRGHPRRHAQDAPALQGPGQRGPVRPRVRHGLRELRRCPPRRRHRDLRARDGRADALIRPTSPGAQRRGLETGPFCVSRATHFS